MASAQCILVLLSCVICTAYSTADFRTTLQCHRRFYSIGAEQADSKGKRCWDNISVKSCWGRCDSNEISDWRFPYKRSHHPVCVHGARRKATAILKNCDDGVTPGTERYNYVEAKNCRCQVCSSSDTSCEWLPITLNEIASSAMGPGAKELIYSTDSSEESDFEDDGFQA